MRPKSRRAACAAGTSKLVTRRMRAVMESAERRLLLASLNSVPALHSNPSASNTMFLDFNGSAAIPGWLGFTVPETPAFDRDSKPKDFSALELNLIQDIWARTAEKFAPFDIDVTTVDPGNLNDNETVKVIFGGDSADWLGPGIDGVATLGG